MPISFRKENLSQGGLKDDFDGRLQVLEFAPWNYRGNIEHYVLGVRMAIHADDGDEVEEFISCGSLDDFWPSKDGVNPVPLGTWDPAKDPLDVVSGPFLVRAPNGKREQLAESNFTGQWIDYAIKSGFDPNAYDSDLRVFQGLYGHWLRVDQAERNFKGKGVRKEKKYKDQILCLVEIKQQNGAQAPITTAQTKAPVSPPVAPSAGGGAGAAVNGSGAGTVVPDAYTATFNKAVLDTLAAAPNNTLTFAELGRAIVKSFSGADKARALGDAADVNKLGAVADNVVPDGGKETVQLL